MEESTEAHMETDVSSTTEDVPETQEVTGSNGNVEMVIVVEKLEEEIYSNNQTETQPLEADGVTNEVSEPNTTPPETTDLEKSPVKSPTKVLPIEAEPSPSEQEVQKVVNKELPVDSEIELSAQTQKTDEVDSSINDAVQMETVDIYYLVENNPNKVPVDTVQNSLKKVQSPVVDQSPEKQSPKLVAVSPIKELELNNATKTTPTKSIPEVSTPTESTPVVSTPTESSPVVSTPAEVIPVISTPTKSTPIILTPTKTTPIVLTPTKTKPIILTPRKSTPTIPIPTKSTPTKSSPAKESVFVEKFVINGKVQCSDTNNDSNYKNVTTCPVDITVERETSNDSQSESMSVESTSSESTEKDHNRSISRELKSLINSAKESKIISECTQLTSKTRKSRSVLDNSSTSLNSSIDADKIHNRRNSNNSQKSGCSEKSEKVVVKRSMRSQNPEFVSKVKQFLNSVTGKGQKESDDEDNEIEEKISKGKDKKDDKDILLGPTPPKLRKTDSPIIDKSGKLRSDSYCWRCHWVIEQAPNEKMHSPMCCTVCPRSFHYKCLSSTERNRINEEKSWVCPECMLILQAESSETRSQGMKKVSLGMLRELLTYALERMMDLNGVEPFLQPVDRAAFPHYDKYVVHPMDLQLMKNNIKEGVYGSTEAFLADAQWILHNSIIFNTLQSKLTAGARALVRSCRAELGEIEACVECYAAAHTRRHTWFTDVCTTPHVLLWAKLKGFPYWPAKGMSVNSAGHIDVRFFGAHDRAWVPSKDCYLYSEKDPNNFRTKRQDIIDSMQEAEEHIRNISRKYGKFVYPPFKTQFEPNKLTEQLKMMIPSFEGEVRSYMKEKSNASPAVKEKRRSNSKSSKSSFNDGEISENEETRDADQSTTSRKMADGAEIAREEEDTNVNKPESNMDVDVKNESKEVITVKEGTPQPNKSSDPSRKRRRSELVEAVITILDTTQETKRKKSDKTDKDKRKSTEHEPTSSKEDNKVVEKTTNGSIESSTKTESTTKDNEPTSSTRNGSENEKRVTPIRIALVPKDKGHNLRTSTAKEAMAKIITPNKDTSKEKDNEKTTPQRQKPSRSDRTSEKTPKDEKSRSEKRRNSRSNRSLSNTPKNEKSRRISLEKKSEKTTEASSSRDKTKDSSKENKDKSNEKTATNKDKDSETDKSKRDKINSPRPTNSDYIKPVKDRLQFDDDTTLAVIARESKTVVISNNTCGLPTISCVRSLSTTAQNSNTTTSNVTTTARSLEITVEPNSSCSVTPSSTDTSKLQRLRNDAESKVGKVGVRAFARMTSVDKSPNKNDNVQVEIKAEPIDVDDADRQIEKLNLMNAFRLRPVNPPVNATNSLREVRINKVLVTPLNAKKTAAKPVEVKPRAKKTFPQPKKPEDGQLNIKNSMVYIPIQPPVTQAPVRPPRVVAGSTCPPLSMKPNTATSSVASSVVNTMTTPVMQGSSVVTTTSSATASTTLASLGQVHTLPVMTSVNGQWMFSFQPVMSVGAIDNSPSPPILNGVAERCNTTITPLPMASTATLNNISTNNTTVTPVVFPANTKTPADGNNPGEPPRLQQRPSAVLMNPFDSNTPIGTMPTPSSAGPLTFKLNQNAVKLTDFFRTLLEDSIEKLNEPATQLTTLRLELERTKWKHQTEIKEIKHNHELTLAEMRALFEKEKTRAVLEARRTAQAELEAAVKSTKAKQWCANCSQESHFYCCWNTSYCDFPCQRAHWSQHFNVCTQERQEGNNADEPPNPPEHRLQPQPSQQPDKLPVLQKNSTAPALTVGGKLAPSRVYTQDQINTNTTAPKSAIIVSMVEDPSGNQTMKCLGTYKAPATPQAIPPIILNKQIMNNEENANKKVVSSGGYLIVGGGANNSAVVTPARRTHTIPYYT